MPLLSVFARSAAAGVALLLSLAFASVASAADVAREWVGAYGYEDGREAVYFELQLTRKGNSLSGHIVETQTFGTRSADGTLKAAVSGSIKGHVVTFTKTYDGTGGQRHSVTYRGTLVSEGEAMFMFGTWRIGADVGSWFATVPSND